VNRMRLALLALLAGVSPAFATNVGVTPGSGATIATTVNTNGDNMSHIVVCDQAAANLNCVTTKAASTAAVAGDQALVVTMHPSTATVPVSGTFWQATQPISAASLPLPSGASTSALQPTNSAIGATTSGQTGTLMMGAALTALPTATTADTWPISINPANGGVRVDGSGVTQPVSGTVTANQGSASGSGPWIETPWIAGAVNGATNGLYVNLLQGNAVASTSNPVFVSAQPAATGGLTTYFLQPIAGTNSTNIKASAGTVYHVSVTNNSATVNYLRFYNTSSAPTCTSATSLVYQLAIPASTSGAGFVQDISAGLAFSTGIGICVSSGYATTDATNATATAISLTIGYK
jgi:hypothetical protein